MLLLLMIYCNLISAYEGNRHIDEDEREKIDIETNNGTLGFERSVFVLDCSIDRKEGKIYVNYEGIGTPIIYIYDENGELYCSHYLSMSPSTAILDLFFRLGSYQIIIQSDVFFGIGTFSIY